MSTPKRTYSAPALEKGLNILETLAKEATPLSQTEIARKLGRSNSEIFRVLEVLNKQGYITRDPETGCYQMSLKMFSLAHMHIPLRQILDASRRPMRKFAKEMDASVHLSIIYEDQLLAIAQELPQKSISLSVEVGSMQPPMETLSGRILLLELARRNNERSPRVGKKMTAVEGGNDEIFRAESSFHESVTDYSILLPLAERPVALAVPSMKLKKKKIDEEEICKLLFQCRDEIYANLGLD